MGSAHLRIGRLLKGLCLLLNLVACSSPVVRLEDQARVFGFSPIKISANHFVLTAFYREGEPKARQLHVYLEGDGRPWEQGFLPAAEPTTRNSEMLPLMALDMAPALYLGRPCYNGHSEESGCDASLWTSARYGERVVTTMATALSDFCQHNGYSEWVLIGHSGGGSLAILLAGRLPQTRALVTLAANYDIDVWADYHRYTRLAESLNPRTTPNAGIPEWHYLAEQDTNIPPALFFQALRNRKNSHVEIIPGIGHNGGWQAIWPKILVKLGLDQ